MTQKPLLWLMSAWQMEASAIQYKERRCQLNHVLAFEQRTRQNSRKEKPETHVYPGDRQPAGDVPLIKPKSSQSLHLFI